MTTTETNHDDDAVLNDYAAQVKKLDAEAPEPNKVQLKTIERLKAAVIEHKGCGRPESYEVKEFTVKPGKYFVSVTIEHGLKNDEGTAAYWYVRDRRTFFVGVRGGVKLVSVNAGGRWKTPNVHGFWAAIRYLPF